MVLVGVYENYSYRTVDCKVGLIQVFDDNNTTSGLCFVDMYVCFASAMPCSFCNLFNTECMETVACAGMSFHFCNHMLEGGSLFKGQGLNLRLP